MKLDDDALLRFGRIVHESVLPFFPSCYELTAFRCVGIIFFAERNAFAILAKAAGLVSLGFELGR